MTARCVSAVSAEIHAHPKTSRPSTSSLVFPNLGKALVHKIPNVEPSVIRCGSQIATVFAQSQSPYFSRLY